MGKRWLNFRRQRIMRNRISWFETVTFAAAVIALVVLSSSMARADNTAEATYKAKCAMCHGPDGKGETATGKAMKAGDFASAEVQKMSDMELSDAISKGKGKMPAYKTLTPDQVKDLVAYIRSLSKK
jgi:mono/diheme cytochrome c family protein